MYESFYGLKEKPFSMLPDPGFLYLSKKHQKALTLFEYGLMNHAGFCVISGEIGSGKTTILRKLLENMDRNITVGMITNTHKGFGNLMDWVLSAFSLHETGLNDVEKHQRFIDFLLEQYADRKTTLLIVDEAQNMEADKLEELRMLSNVNSDKDQVIQIILAGQPELKDTLQLPELKQFVQRISVDYHLGSLDSEDTHAYIAHRLSVAGAESSIFTEEACDLIFKYSGGTPRLINLLCDTAMVYGFADQQKIIGEDIVVEMILERMQGSLVPLACTEPPKKKLSNSVDVEKIEAEGVAEKALESDVVEFTKSVEEHDLGEKVMQAAIVEHDAEIARHEEVEDLPPEQEEQASHASISAPASAGTEKNEVADLKADPFALPSKNQSKRSRFLQPMLIGLSVLVIATLFFAISLDIEEVNKKPSAVVANKYKNKPEVINRSGAEPTQEAVQSMNDEIREELNSARKLQQEMIIRQREDRARMKALEEKTVLLQRQRDNALVKAKSEEKKRAAEIKAIRAAKEGEIEAQKIAQKAISDAMAAELKAKLLEELRVKEQQASAERLEAQQKEIDDAAEAVEIMQAIEAENAKEEEAKKDAGCASSTARFLSTCR